MTDRIANPWGARTPFGRGGEWPARVDQFLEEGLSEGDVDRWVQTASILHSNGDALDIALKDGRMVGVRGRAVDRVNKGRVDPKDLFGWQANASEDRLKLPLVRKDGELVEASWDEAYGRQHPTVHRDRCAGAQGDLRYGRAARLLRRHRSRRRYHALRPQHGRDAGRDLDARPRPARRAESTEARRGGPASHACRQRGKRASPHKERHQRRAPQRFCARDPGE